MAEDARLICRGSEVMEAGRGFRFTVEREGRAVPAFVIRFNGRVHPPERMRPCSGRAGLDAGRILRSFQVILDLLDTWRALCS